jgi:hypothetical protein
MACSVAFSCDICGNPKREVNHWWMIITDHERTESSPAVGNSQENLLERRFSVVPWHVALADKEGVHHACGQMCVLRAIERYMGGREIFAADISAEANPSTADAVEPDTQQFDGMSEAENIMGRNIMGHMDMDSMMAFDVDEEGELSAVLSRARPGTSRRNAA